MKMYRVDRRNFNISDIIETNKDSYQDSKDFGENKQKLERILTEELPSDKQADRKGGLYIFAELSDAIRFCYLMSNSKIYEVASSSDTICYHRGDMNWTEIMNNFLNDDKTLRQMAKLYWQSKKTFKPCWEMLVNRVQVTELVLCDNQKRNDIVDKYREISGNVERIRFYVDIMNQTIEK
jgi:hypothetical protein